MDVKLSPAELSAFEREIADLFLQKHIRAPIHLSSGNENQLIEVFQTHVDEQDWVCTAWRSHFHCLLKGVPPEKLKKAILEGHSISLCFPKHRIISSAIVGGIAPIAVGLAAAVKRKEEKRKVVCFLGDMSFEAGITFESVKYAINHNLPVLWVVEDNEMSVQTDTMLSWGATTTISHPSIVRYKYENSYPHVGLSQWVTF